MRRRVFDFKDDEESSAAEIIDTARCYIQSNVKGQYTLVKRT